MGERTLPTAGQLFLDRGKNLVQFIAIAIYKRMEGEIAVYQALSGDYKIYAMPYADFIMEMVPYTPQKEIPFTEDSSQAEEAGNSFRRPNPAEAVDNSFRRPNPTESADNSYRGSKQEVETDNSNRRVNLADEARNSFIRPSSMEVSDKTFSRPKQAEASDNSFRRPRLEEAAEPVERGGGDGGNREESEAVNPVLLAFLDADTYEEKLNVLTGSRKYLDDRLLTHMAISVDCVIGEGDAEEKINNLIFCLKTRARFENNRLR